MQVDILAFGPHPDDIEIGAGATIAKAVRQGQAVGLCDLTRGELGSNGTVEERLAEAGAAAETLGATWRENLGWPDGAIGGDDQLRDAVELLRRSRPATVLIPYWDDRHPDHVAASRLLASAVFKARLRRFGAPGEAWSPDWVCHYYINNAGTPSCVVDVAADYDSKRRALDCHRSQFVPQDADAVATRLTASSFRRLIESRDAGFGAAIGVEWAEGFVVRAPLQRAGVMK